MDEKNPFIYGKVVSRSYFYGRSQETAEIKELLKAGQNLIIYAPRRFGKTSLIKKIIDELEQEDYVCIFIDFFKVISMEKFVKMYSHELLAKRKGNWQSVLQWFSSFVKGITPSLSFDQGEPTFKLDYKALPATETDISEVINLANKLDEDKKVVVVFDEFQEINSMDGEVFEKQLRANIQFHNNVSYVFMGSKTHLIKEMFENKSRAFYKSGKMYPINKIPRNESEAFVAKRFSDTKVEIHSNAVQKILDLSENIPYYLQYISSETWNLSFVEKLVTIEKVYQAKEKILDAQGDYYREIVSNLSLYQKKLLSALCQSGEKIFSTAYSKTYNLGASSSTQRAVQKLIQNGHIENEGDRYIFSDPFFQLFLLERFWGPVIV